MKFLKKIIPRFIGKSSKPPISKEHIKNALKTELFRCEHPKYKFIEGRVRYWRIMKKDCHPGGCTNIDGNESFSINPSQNPIAKPILLVSQEEFDQFLRNDLKRFLNWNQKCQHRFLNFMGVIHAVKPRFDIKIAREKLVTFKGFALIFKECMINNIFFNDFVYVLIGDKQQYEMNFSKTDTVSGTGFFTMDEKGITVLSRAEKVKIVAKGVETEQINKNFSPDLEFRLVDPFIQDICELCPYSLLVRVKKTIVDRSSRTPVQESERNFSCTLENCILIEEKTRQLVEKTSQSKQIEPK